MHCLNPTELSFFCHTQSFMLCHLSGSLMIGPVGEKKNLFVFVLQRMCGTSSARPQCTTTFPSTGTANSSVCTLGTTARRTSATSSSPSSCRYVGYIRTPTDQCQVFHYVFEVTIFTLSILVSCVPFFFFFFFRSCSWSMHARHSPKRTKARMASSPPWTSVTLWPPSDTTCSHRLWRRTLSQ